MKALILAILLASPAPQPDSTAAARQTCAKACAPASATPDDSGPAKPHTAEAYAKRAWDHSLAGDADKARQDAWNDYDAAVKADPRNAASLYGRGIAALRLSRMDTGRDDLAGAEALAPATAQNFAGYGITP